MTPFYILSGPPGVGKTSVLDALRGYVTVVDEPARRVIAAERMTGGHGTGDQNPERFISLMMKSAQSDYVTANGVTVFDRGLPDLLAFCAYYGLDDTRVSRMIAAYRYHSKVFWFPSWPEIYCQDDERTLDYQGAFEFGERVRKGYLKSGYELIEVPKASVSSRAEFILEKLWL